MTKTPAETSVGLTERNRQLSRFGFNIGRGGVHTSRTMMLAELQLLLMHINRPNAEKSDYIRAICDENCLGKRSGKTRTLTCQHLVALYSLDRTSTLFRNLLHFWNRDVSGQPLLALTCTYARDPVFRTTMPFILQFSEGATITRESLEEFLDARVPGRFSKATLKSTAQNINATWTKSGHLRGRVRKVRSRANPTAGSVAYALLLGYLAGVRGQSLFQTEYVRLLDCTPGRAIELAEEAARKGWIVFKRVDNIVEVVFPRLINQEETEWLREQNQAADPIIQQIHLRAVAR